MEFWRGELQNLELSIEARSPVPSTFHQTGPRPENAVAKQIEDIPGLELTESVFMKTGTMASMESGSYKTSFLNDQHDLISGVDNNVRRNDRAAMWLSLENSGLIPSEDRVPNSADSAAEAVPWAVSAEIGKLRM